MNLTTKGRYAVMAMVDLAMNGGQKPVTLADIATRQGIAVSYLEQIFMRLRKSGLVRSVRGPGGGYIMPESPKKISISSIVVAVDESIRMTRCGDGGKGGCTKEHNTAKCMTHNLWQGLSDKIYEYLESVSLDDVCKRIPLGKNKKFSKEEANV